MQQIRKLEIVNSKFKHATQILTTLGSSDRPLTIYDLGGGIDGNTVIPSTLLSLLEVGYVSRASDRHYCLSCKPEEVCLFELKEAFGQGKWDVKSSVSDIIDESLQEITISRLIEFGKPKQVTIKAIRGLEDCLHRIEKRTGEKFPETSLSKYRRLYGYYDKEDKIYATNKE